jgi:hypothetical protein
MINIRQLAAEARIHEHDLRAMVMAAGIEIIQANEPKIRALVASVRRQREAS